jgi:hypothetical protein
VFDDDVEVDFTNGVGDVCAILEDVWVSPNGNDSYNLGTSEQEPFLTIAHALEVIAPDKDNPVNIFLTEGVFSVSNTGENFPIIMISNANIIGQSKENSIISGELPGFYDEASVIEINGRKNINLSKLTLTGGDYWRGGGLHLEHSSSVRVSNAMIIDNESSFGGGVYAAHSSFQMHRA